MKKNVPFIFYSFFSVVVMVSCIHKNKEDNEVRTYQESVIKKALGSHEKLNYIYYPDSIIKEVFKLNGLGEKQGRIISFSPKGKLKRIYFINNTGNVVGDESVFNNTGILSEHFFRLDIETLLFYSKFNNQGSLIVEQGHPWFLQGLSDVQLGDTLVYYIACPLIPNFKTHVKFGMSEEPSSWVSYSNDLRQFTYKRIMIEEGRHKFNLKVEIRNKENKIVIKDSTNIFVNVYR